VGDGSLWVANPFDDTVTKLAFDGTHQGTYGVGDSPFGVVVAGDGVWVTNVGDAIVTELSLAGNKLGTFNVGPRPVGIAAE